MASKNDVTYFITEAKTAAGHDPAKAQQLTQAALNTAKTLEVLAQLP